MLNLTQIYADTPEPEPAKRRVRHYDPKYIGKTGLSKYEFIAQLFRENELLPQDERWTPARQAAAINLDFEKEEGDQGYITLPKLGQRRNKYNMGELLANWPRPHLIAIRYSKGGIPLSPAHSAKPAGIHDLRKLCRKYRIADPRFVKPEELEELKQRREMNIDFAGWVIPPQEVVELHPFDSLELTGFCGGRYSNLFS